MFKKCIFFIICCWWSHVLLAHAINLREYFPVQAGYGWIYVTDSDSGNNEYIINVMQPLDNEQVRYLEKGQIDFPNNVQGNSFLDLKWEESGLRVYYLFDIETNREKQFNPAALYLPLNLEVGESKDTIFGLVELENDDVTIEVPAGIFDHCLQMKLFFKDGYEIWWLAKGIGIVKRESYEENGEKETSMLVSARINNTIIGEAPLCNDNIISFVFSNVKVHNGSLIIDGIYLKNYNKIFWAKFDFDLNNLAFILDINHYGEGNIDQSLSGIYIPGLTFDGIVPYVWTCKTGFTDQGGVAIFLKAIYNHKDFYLELVFDPKNYVFRIFKLWDAQKKIIF